MDNNSRRLTSEELNLLKEKSLYLNPSEQPDVYQQVMSKISSPESLGESSKLGMNQPSSVDTGLIFEQAGRRSKFDRRTPLDTVLEGGIQDFRGSQQSVGDKLANGIFIRFPLTTATKLLEGMGYVATAPLWLLSGDISTMTENPISETFARLEEKIKEIAPIYKPAHLKDANLLENLSSASFWMDEGVDAAAFFAGFAAFGYGLGALKAGSKIAKLIGTGSKSFMRGVDLTLATTAQTVSEAGFEAAHFGKEFDKTIEQELGNLAAQLEMQGATPEEIDHQLSLAEQELKQNKAEAQAKIFRTNVGILVGPNLIMNKFLFGRFFNGEGSIAGRLFGTSDDVINAAKQYTTKEIASEFGKRAGISALSEGFWEEGMQETTTRYFEEVALGKNNDSFVEGMFNTYIESLGDVNFQKAIFLGSLLGTLGGGYGAIREKVADNERLSKVHQTLSEHPIHILDRAVIDEIATEGFTPESFMKLYAHLDNLSKIIKKDSFNDLLELAKKDDVKGLVEHLGTLDAFYYLLSMEGGLTAAEQKLDSITESAFEEYAKQQGIEPKAKFESYKQDLKGKLQQFKEIMDTVDDKYSIQLSELRNNTGVDTKAFNDYRSTVVSQIMYALTASTASREYMRNLRQSKSSEKLALLNKYGTLSTEEFMESSEVSSVDKDKMSKIDQTIESSTELIKKFDEDFKSLTDISTLQDYLSEYVKTQEEIKKKLEDANKQDVQTESGVPSNITDPVLNDIRSQTLTSEEVVDDKGVKRSVPYRGNIELTFEKTNADGTTVESAPAEYKVLEVTKDGNLKLQPISDPTKRTITIAPNGQILNGKSFRWTNWRVTKTADQVKLEEQTIHFKQALLRAFPDKAAEYEQLLEELVEANEQLKLVEKSLKNAAKRAGESARIPINETNRELIVALTDKKLKDTQKAVFLTVKQLEALRERFINIMNSSKISLDTYTNFMQSKLREFSPEVYLEFTEVLEEEAAKLEEIVRQSDDSINYLTNKINNLKRWIKNLYKFINNKLKDAGLLDSKGQYIISFENGMSELENVNLSEIEGAERNIDKALEKISRLEKELAQALEEVPVDAKRRLRELTDEIKSRKEIFSLYEQIRREYLLSTFDNTPAKPGGKSLSGDEAETNVEDDKESYTEPELHPFAGYVGDLFNTTVNELEFEKNPVLFEPQLRFQRFIDDYDVSTRQKVLKLMNATLLVERHGDQLTQEQKDNLLSEAGRKGVYAVLYDRNGSAVTEDSLFVEGSKTILFSVLPEGTKQDGRWVNKRPSGFELVSENSFYRTRNLEPKSPDSKEAFNQAFHKAFEEYNKYREGVREQKSPVTVEIVGKTAGTLRTKDLPETNVVGTIADTEEALGDVMVILGDGTTKQNIGGSEKVLEDGIVKIVHKGRIVNTYRQNMIPEDVDRVFQLIQGAILNSSNEAVRDEFMSAINEITFLNFESTATQNKHKYTLYLTRDSKGKITGVSFGKRGFISADVLLGAKKGETAITTFRDFLSDKFYNVTKDSMELGKRNYEELSAENTYDSDGKITSSELVVAKTWNNYKQYLMSGENNRTPRFKVKLPVIENSIDAMTNSPFINRSVIYQPPITQKQEVSTPTTQSTATPITRRQDLAAEVLKEETSTTSSEQAVPVTRKQYLADEFAGMSAEEANALEFDDAFTTEEAPPKKSTPEEDFTSPLTSGELTPNPAIEEDFNPPITQEQNLISEEENGEESDKLKNLTPEQISNLLGGLDVNTGESLPGDVNQPLTTPVGVTRKQRVEEQLKEFRKRFPDVVVETDPDLSTEALLELKNGKLRILVRPETVEGGLFHEGFHFVNLLVNTKEQRDALYKEVRKRLGKAIVTIEGNEVVGEEMTDYQAEEFLAEEFRNFMLIGKNNYKFGKSSAVQKSVFQKIVDAIEKLLKFFGMSTRLTESLFDRIESGVFSVSNVVNVENVTAYRIGELTSEDSRALVEYVNYRFFDIFNNHKDYKDLDYTELSDIKLVYKIYTQIAAEVGVLRKSGNYPPILRHYNTSNLKDIYSSHLRYLKQYNIKVNFSRDSLEESGNIDNRIEIPKQFVDSTEIDVKETVGVEIKLLIAGLPHKVKTKNGVALATNRGLERTVPYAQTIGVLHKHLAGINSYEDMVYKLAELSEQYPHFNDLLERLGSTAENAYSIKDEKLSNLRSKFFSQFHKAENIFMFGIIHEGGVYYLDGSAEATEKFMVEQWKANAATKNVPTPALFTSEQGKLRLNMKTPITVNGVKITLEQVLGNFNKFKSLTNAVGIINQQKAYRDFLNSLGFNLTEEFGELQEDLALMSRAINLILNNAETLLKERTKKYKQSNLYLEDLYSREAIRINKEIKELASRLSQYSEHFIGNQSMDGKGRFIYNLNDKTNIHKLIDDLSMGIPFYLEPFDGNTGRNFGTIGSRWIKHYEQDGKIQLVILKGFGEERSDKIDFDELTPTDYAAFEFNAVLNGKLPYLRSAERGIEIAFDFGRDYVTFKPSELKRKRMQVFTDYLRGEIISAYAHQNEKAFKHLVKNDFYKELSFFATILPELNKSVKNEKRMAQSQYEIRANQLIEVNRKYIESKITEYFENQRTSTLEYLLELGVIKKSSVNGVAVYDVRGLDTQAISAAYPSSKFDFSKMDAGTMETLIDVFNFEYISGTIEQTKLVTGDVNTFKKLAKDGSATSELHKRTTLHTATISGSMNDAGFVDELNEFAPRIDGRDHTFRAKVITRKDTKVQSAEIETVKNTLKDSKEVSVYESMTEDDAGGKLTLDGTESYLRRYGKLTTGKAKTLQYQKQFFFRYLISNNRHSELFNEERFKKVFKRHLPENYSPNKMYYLGEEIKFSELEAIEIFKPQSTGRIANNSIAPSNKVQSLKLSLAPMMPTDIVGTQLFEDLIEATVSGADFTVPLSARKHEVVGNNKGQLASVYDSKGNLNSLSKVVDPKNRNAQLVEEIYWNDIGDQVEIDASGKSEVVFSTQMRRLAIVDIMTRGNIRDGMLDLSDDVIERNHLHRAQVERDLKKLLGGLGLSKSEDNQYKLTNDAKFIDTIIRQLDTRLQPNSVADSVVYVMEQAEKYFQTLPTQRQLVNLVQGLIRNRVIKTKTKGDMLVQEPSTGYETGARTVKNGKLVSGVLNFYSLLDENGNKTTDLQKAVSVAPAEIIIGLPKEWVEPIRKLLGHSEFTQETLDEFNYLMKQDGKQKDSKGKTIEKWKYYDVFKQLRTVLANRVPTQHLNSMEVFEVVEFKSPAFGPRIVLPSEVVAKSGSDFDIDKLTTYFNSIVFNSETGVPVYEMMGSTVENSTDGALKNRINELTQKMILDVRNFPALIKPNNSNIVDEQAKIVSSEKETADVAKLLTFKYNAQIGKTQFGAKKLIGIAAVNNTFHALMQSFPVGLSSNIVELFFDNFKDSSGQFNFGYYTNDEFDVISSTIGNIMTAIVDAAKHSIAPIDLVNLTTSTSNSYFMLMMLGRGETSPTGFRKLTKFFTQPIVLELEKAFRTNESALRKALDETTEKKSVIINTLLSNDISVPEDHKFLYEYMADVLKSSTSAGATVAKEELRKVLNEYKNMEDGAAYLTEDGMKKNPLLVAEFFLYYQELGKAMRLLQSITRPDASLPKDRVAVRVRQELLERLKTISIFDNEALDKLYEKSFIGAYKDVHDVTYEAFNEFDAIQDIESFQNFIWGENGLARTYMNPELGKPETDIVDAIHKISNAAVTYMLHTVKKRGRTIANLENNPASEALYTRFMVGNNSMANRLERLKKRFPKDNAFLSESVGVVKEFVQRRGTNRKNDYIKFYNRKLNVEQANAISESIEDMANHSDPEVKKFAKDLVLLSIIQSGVQISPVSFFEKLPPQLYHAVVQDLFTLFKMNKTVLGMIARRSVYNNLRGDRNVVPRVFKKYMKPSDTQTTIHSKSQMANYDYLSVELNHGTKDNPKYEVYLLEKTGEVNSKGQYIYRKLEQRGDGYAMFDARPISNVALPKVIRKDSEVVQDVTYEIIPDDPDTTITPQQKQQAQQNNSDISTFTNHSGGAIGSDTAWDTIGREFGMTNNKHYYFEGYKTPNGNTSIPISLKNEADVKLKEANKTLGRKFPTSKEHVNNLLRRNWWQVKNSDSIFAISTITDNKVDGGTGWAVHMAIVENKPVYVFDQNKNKWFTWSNNKFVETTTPKLTKNFAGIGTREINESGKQAIRDVYEASSDPNTEELQLDTGRRLETSEIEADKKLLSALKTVWDRLGLRVQAVEEIFYEGRPVDAIAKANALLGVIEYVENKRNIKSLPEETAHIFVSLLPENHPLKKVMFKEIVNTPYYEEVVSEYGEIYKGNEAKLKSEAVGKAITDAMVEQNSLRMERESWGKVKTWWRGLRRWFKELFGKQDPYTKAAIKLLDNNLNDLISRSELTQREDESMLQISRLDSLDDYAEAMREQRRIQEEQKLQKEFNERQRESLYTMEDSDIAEADRIQLAQSEQDMAASEEKVIKSNAKELQKVEPDATSEQIIKEQLDNFEKFYPLFADQLTTQSARREFIRDIMSGKLQIIC